MLKPFIFAASAALVVASPVLAAKGFTIYPPGVDPTSALISEALYTGEFNSGLAQLVPLAAKGDTKAAFGVGTIKLTMAIQGLAQTLYRHGFDLPGAPEAGISAGVQIPQNPSPEPFDYAGVRKMLSDFVAGLDDARASFDVAAKSGDYVIELNPLKILIDANGDGKVEQAESLAGLYAMWTHVSLDEAMRPHPDGASPAFEFIGLDRADAYWLAGYTDVLAAQADFVLAHDFSSFTDAAFHRFFPKAGFPMQDYSRGNGMLIMSPDTDTGIADLVAAVHTIDWPVTDAAKLSGVRDRLKSVLAYSRQNWDAILAETDDNHELLPSPKQTGLVPKSSITDERVAAWRATLDEADKILDGALLIPHWRFKQGFDLKAYFDTAKQTDLVMLLTGLDALPFLKDGPVASATDFRAIQAAFGNYWLGYAFWFN